MEHKTPFINTACLILLTLSLLTPDASFGTPLTLRAHADEPIEGNCVISNAVYDVNVNDSSADTTLNLSATIIRDKWTEVVISPIATRISFASSDDILLIKDKQNNKLVFKKKGTYQVKCRLTIPVEPAQPMKKISIPLVTATFTKINVTIPEGNIGLIVSPEVTYEKKEYRHSTELAITAPLADEITVSWGPRELLEQPLDTKVTVMANAIIENELISYHHTITFHPALAGRQSSRLARSFKVGLPKNARLLDVTESEKGKRYIDRWFIEEATGQNLLNIVLENPAYDTNFSCAVLWEKPLPAGGSFTVEPAEVIGYKKQTGKLWVIYPINAVLDEDRIENLTRQNVYQGTLKNVGTRACNQYTYTALPASLTATIKPKQPQVFASSEILHHIRQDSVLTTVRLLLDIKNIGIDYINLNIPGKVSNVFIQGDKVKSYKPADGRVRVDLTEKTLGQIELQLSATTEPSGTLTFLPVTVEGAISQHHLIAIKPDNMDCEVGRTSKLIQVSPERLPGWLNSQNPTLAFESDATDWQLKTAVTPLKSVIELSISESIYFDEESINRQAALRLSVKKEALFGLQLEIPENTKPAEVSSPILKEWTYDETSRILRVSFNTGIKDKHQLYLRLETLSKPSALCEIKPIVVSWPPLKLLTYTIILYSPRGVALQPQSMENIRESTLQTSDMPATGPIARRAFLSAAPLWTLYVNVTPEPPRLIANTYTGLSIREGQMQVTTAINYRVKSGYLKRLQVKLPDKAINSEVTGDNIKNRTFFDNTWELNLGSRVTDAYTLYVRYEQSEPRFRPIKLPDAELEKGLVLVSAGNERTELSSPGAPEVQIIPVSEAESGFHQDVRRQLPYPPSLAVHFTKPDIELPFILKTHELSAMLPAKVISCDLFSVNQANGKLLTYLNPIIENTVKQYLEVKLPYGATLWGAYVDDKPVKAVTRDSGEIMVPLISVATAESRIPSGHRDALTATGVTRSKQTSVVIAYVQDINTLTSASRINLQMPQADINIQGATWHMFLPQGHFMSSPGGNMELVYADPQITQPSLTANVYNGFAAFIHGLWSAIPWWVKAAAVRLLFYIIVAIGITIFVSIFILLFNYFGLSFRKLARVGVAVASIAVVFLVIFAISIPNLLTSRESRKYAPQSAVDVVNLNNGFPPPAEEIKEEFNEEEISRDDVTVQTSIVSGSIAHTSAKQEEKAQSRNNRDFAAAQQTTPQSLALGNDAKQLQELKKMAQDARKQSKQSEGKDKKDNQGLEYKRLANQPERQGLAGQPKPPATPAPAAKPADKVLPQSKVIAEEEIFIEETFIPDTEPEATEDVDESGVVITNSPLKGKRVYDTIGIGGGSGGGRARRGGRKMAAKKTEDKEAAGDTYGWRGDESKEVYGTLGKQLQDGAYRHESPTSGKLFGKTQQGRQSGALPISVAMPLHTPYYYAFESLYLGKSSGNISFWCLSAGLILFLQSLFCLALGVVIFFLARFDITAGLYGALGIIAVMLLGQWLTEGIIRQVVLSGLAFSIVIGIVILIVYKRSHRLHRWTQNYF